MECEWYFATQWLTLDPFDKQIYLSGEEAASLSPFIDERRVATREPFFVNRPPINFSTGRPLWNDPAQSPRDVFQ